MSKKRNTKFTDTFSEQIWHSTYKYHTDEDVNDSHLRIAKDLASLEKDKEYWTEKFLDILEDFKFVPGGRINSNAGTGLKGTTYINCFVDGFTGKNQDSMEGIMDALKRQALILKSEGGYGFCADVMRPRGAFVEGIGVEGPGAVKMLDMWDKQSEVITAGSGEVKKEKKGKNKIRKGAQMVTMSVWHGDIEEFITAKQTPGRLTKFNMSVLVTDEFMRAVENNLPWNLEFPVTSHESYDDEWDGNLKKWKEKGYPTKIYKTYENANVLWDLIMKSTYNRNEPGVLFVDTINKMNNLFYSEHISATNPCITGDTLVYVADGRGHVPIKQLAEEGKDVPVFALDFDGKLVIRMMRNPRITGHREKIYKLTLDDGSVVKATSNHKFRLKDGRYVELKDLKAGDSLQLLTKYEASIKDIFQKSGSNSQDYYWINNGQYNSKISEHKIVSNFNDNIKIKNKEKLAGIENISVNYRSKSKYKELIESGYNCFFKNNTLCVLKKCEICRNEIKVRAEFRENSICSKECYQVFLSKLNKISVQGQVKNGIQKNTNVENQLKIYSELKFNLKREVLRKEWKIECQKQNTPFRLGKTSPFKNFSELREKAKDYNHKVLSIEYIGEDTVYNGTVDEFHNFFVGGFESLATSGKKKFHYINNLQCGEQVLPNGGVCLLGSINLTQFVDLKNKTWDFKKIKEHIPSIVRFMDNVNDKTRVPLKVQESNLKEKRRIGLGYMGYASALFMLKVRYGSKEALQLTEELCSFVVNEAYKASSLLAKEKGSFILFDKDKYLTGEFVKKLNPETLKMIKENGLRNSHLSSIQPTGNSSIYANNVSGGLEPVFMPEYVRTTIVPHPPEGLSVPVIDWANKSYSYSDKASEEARRIKWEWVKEGDENLILTEFNGKIYKIDQSRGLLNENKIQDYAVRELSKKNEWDPSADWAVDASKLNLDDHISTMKVFSRYIDSAMSKCVVEGTLISTTKGIKPIESLSDFSYQEEDVFSDTNDDYKIYDENGNLKKITKHYYGGYKDCYKIKFDNGFSISAAETHMLKTQDGYKRIDELEVGDRVFYRTTKMDIENKYQEIPNPNFYNCIPRKFPKVANPDFSLFLGMWLADGCVSKNSIRIVEKDEEVGRTLDKLFEKIFNIKPKVTIDKRNGVRTRSINSVAIAKLFKSLFGEKAAGKKIPDFILKSPKDVQIALLNGLTLDGYIHNGQLVVYDGYSEQIATAVSYMLSNLGIHYLLVRKKVKNGLTSNFSYGVIAYMNSKELDPIELHKKEYKTCSKKQIQIFVPNNIRNNIINKMIKRDKDKKWFFYRNSINSVKNKSFLRIEACKDLHLDLDYNLSCVKIKEKKYIGKKRVFDIEVEDTHSYLINGIVSHNTVNLPNSFNYEEFKNLYLDVYKTGLIKGCTTYRAGTMTSVLAAESSATKKEEPAEESPSADAELPITRAPKRPKSLPCDIHHLTASGTRWIVFVGLMGHKPYEVFAFKSEKLSLPHSLTKGILTKNKDTKLGSQYSIEFADGWALKNIHDFFETDEQEALTRMISTALRHGAKAEFIIDQLQKSEGTVVSFSKAVARTLKKYMGDEQPVSMKCSECGSKDIAMQEGCFVCKSCGSSKCS